jgi:hypothetical protein
LEPGTTGVEGPPEEAPEQEPPLDESG